MKKIFRFLIILIVILFFYSKSRMSSSNNDKLNALVDEIEQKIPNMDQLNPEVSKAAVSWHLAHGLKVIDNICNALEKSNSNDFKSSFNLKKIIVLTGGIIPRGSAQSPKSSRPTETVTAEDIHTQLEIIREKLNSLSELDENAFFGHPIFNNLNKSKSLRFMEVHTNHHLKIVRDILEE